MHCGMVQVSSEDAVLNWLLLIRLMTCGNCSAPTKKNAKWAVSEFPPGSSYRLLAWKANPNQHHQVDQVLLINYISNGIGPIMPAWECLLIYWLIDCHYSLFVCLCWRITEEAVWLVQNGFPHNQLTQLTLIK